MSQDEITKNPRVVVIQKLYSYSINQDSEIKYPKHRFKKFIKDVVKGTIERKDLITKLIDTELKDNINDKKTEFITKIMLMAAIYEFMYMHKTPVKVIITEYLKVSDFFSSKSQKSFLNAILDKASKISRITDE
jgi:transcription antitermination protein NusB